MGSTIPLLCASWVVAFESALEFREETSTFGLQERQNLHDTSDRAVQSVLASGSVCRKVIRQMPSRCYANTHLAEAVDSHLMRSSRSRICEQSSVVRALAFRSYNCVDMNRMLRVLCSIVVAAPLLFRAQAPAPNEKVPIIDGGVGRCSLELTVLGVDRKPVYAATVTVHVKYGFGGMRRLDLEAGTNSDGKVKFAGLPARVQ
jgi:hypothetical protein